MQLRHGIAAALAGSVIFASACGGGVDSACGDYFDAFEGLLQECAPALAADPASRSASVSACSRLASAPGAGDLAGSLESCASKLKSLEACSLAGFGCTLHGTLADGSPCASSAQCAGGACANAKSSATSELACGTCATVLAPGAACSSSSDCDSSVGNCQNGKCTAYGAQGAPCSTQAPCAINLVCSSAGTCDAIPGNGQPCTTVCLNPYRCVAGSCTTGVSEGGACPNGGECATGLECANKTCAKPTLAAAGQPCGSVNGNYTGCVTGTKCENQVCATVKQSGEACVVGNSECAVDLLCIAGTCQVPDYASCK